MATDETEKCINEARLIASSPEAAFSELVKYGNDVKGNPSANNKDMEESLLARNDPLIDMALARYAYNHETVASLYKKSLNATEDHLKKRYLKGLRVACLSNVVVGSQFWSFAEAILEKDELDRLISSGSDDELNAFLSNPNIDDELLESLYLKNEPFCNLSEERHISLIIYSANNPRLTTEEEGYDMPDIGYSGIHHAILQLLSSAPVTISWLHTLRHLLDQLDPGAVRIPNEPITPILCRWENDFSDKEKNRLLKKGGHYTDLPFLCEFRCLVAAMYGAYWNKEGDDLKRMVVGDLNSEDVALRCAYYGNAELTLKDMNTGYERDDEAYILSVLCNDHVYFKTELRKHLENQQLYGCLAHIYQRRCNQIHKRWKSFDPEPINEWFIEEEITESGEMIMLKRIQESVTSIPRTINILHREVIVGLIILGAVIIYIAN